MPINGGNQGPPRLWRALILAALIPIAAIALALWLGLKSDALRMQQKDMEHAYELRAAVATVISEIKEAETDQRGLVLTRNPGPLRLHMAARARIDVETAHLRRLIAGEIPEVKARSGKIDTLVSPKMREMEPGPTVRDRQGMAGTARVGAGSGKPLADLILQEASALDQREDAYRNRQMAVAAREVQDARRLVLGGMIAASLSAFFVAALIWRRNRARHKAMVAAMNASARQSAIFLNAPNAMVLIDAEGGIETLNPAAERMFGYAAADVVRRDISVIADLAPGEGLFLQRIGLGLEGPCEPCRLGVHARRADGTAVRVDVMLGLMSLEDGAHVIAAFIDVTEREKAEEMKEQLVATVSHELRTPLTAIVGSLSLLKAGSAGPVSDPARALVAAAEKSAHRLIRIADDLLDAEQLQTGRMSFAMAPVDLCDVVGTAAKAMNGLATVKGIKLDVQRRTPAPQPPPVVEGDGERLMQVVNNLISNAIKFSPAGTHIDVRIASEGDRARVTVTDQGQGIPEPLRRHIFTRYVRSPGTNTAGMPGAGLGLSIAREIIRAHGGEIGFLDGEEGGTVFWFDLPLQPAAPHVTTVGDARPRPRKHLMPAHPPTHRP